MKKYRIIKVTTKWEVYYQLSEKDLWFWTTYPLHFDKLETVEEEINYYLSFNKEIISYNKNYRIIKKSNKFDVEYIIEKKYLFIFWVWIWITYWTLKDAVNFIKSEIKLTKEVIKEY